MKCERCGKELADIDLYCQRCGKAVFPEYMDEDDIWAFYKSDEELIEILKEEGVEELPESLKKKNIPDVIEPALEEIREEVPEEEVQEQEKEPLSEETAEEAQEDASEESENLEESGESEEQEELETSKEDFAEESLEESGKSVEKEDAEDIESFSEKTERKIEDSIEEPETESFEEAEILQGAPLEEASQEETLQTEKEENRESEDLEEDGWDFDEEEDEDDEEDSALVLTPQMKKARRWKRLGIAVFLAACLGLGIYFGLNRMKEMENQEKQYYENLKKSSQEPVQTPEEQPKEPAEDTSAETQTPAEEPREEPKEEPPKEEAKKEYFKLVNPDEIDFSQYTKIQPASTEENSVKQSESYDYSSKSVVDGDVTTSWQENEEGAGEGKGFKLNLDGVHKIRYVVLHLGNWRSDQLWDYNARPKTLTIQVGDQQKKDVEFPNEKKKFCLSFEEPVESAYVSAYIKEAYEGSRWNDNCISEIELYE